MNSALIFLFVHVQGVSQQQCPNSLSISWVDSISGLPHNYTFSSVDFNQKVISFALENTRPPLKEAYFIHSLPDEVFKQVLSICREIAIIAELICADADLFVGAHPSKGSPRFWATWSVLNALSADEFYYMSVVWKVGELVARFNKHAGEWPVSSEPSVSFVVCHCRESLSWLVSALRNVPSQARLYVYEKCGQHSALSLSDSGASEIFKSVTVYDQPDGPVRGDECTAYLHFIVDEYEALPDFTVFLQADAERHMFISYLSTALAGLSSGHYSVPFLHLNFHRHYQTTTPCMRDVERLIFNLSEPVQPTPLLGTYCCAQFIVAKHRIAARSQHFYDNALSLVNNSVADVCSPDPPRRSSHCYVLEYLWHVVFGEERFLPFKADNRDLPSLLRMKYGNENVKKRWDDVELEKHISDRLINRTVEIFS